MRVGFLFTVFFISLSCRIVAAAESPPPFTQKDLARMIITEYGWEKGLPKDPTDRDYLVLLGGKRQFLFEAEHSYNPDTDNLTLRDYPLYGAFSGKGWLMGVSHPTLAHLTFLLPREGEYALRARVKGEGFRLQIGGAALNGGSGLPDFSEVEFGKIVLSPGIHLAEVTIPPEGGLDYLALTAPDLPPVQPFDGWRFKEQLTRLKLAEVGISLTDVHDRLPQDQHMEQKVIAAVDAALSPSEAAPTTANFLGQFHSRAWLRAGYRGGEITIPVKGTEPGFHVISARLLGERIQGSVNGRPFSVTGKPYLETIELGIFRLESGENLIRLQLPPMGGVDVLYLARKDHNPARITALAGVEGNPAQQVTAEEARSYLARLRGQNPRGK